MSDGALFLAGKTALYVVIGFIISRFTKAEQGGVASRFLTWLLLAPTTLVVCIFALGGHPAWIAVFALVCGVWFGGPIAKRVATPAGLPRVAQAFAASGALPYHRDWRGIGAIAAARACLVIRHRRQTVPESELAWVEKRIMSTKILRPGTVVARAFCALVLGDRDQAKLLFKSVGDFAPGLRGGPPEVFAARWLVADAASRGDWTALQELPRRLNTTLTRFAAVCATRITLGPASVPRSRLLDKWLATSSRIGAFPLLRMAWTAADRPCSNSDAPLLARHVAALQGQAQRSALVALADDWQAELDGVPELVRRTVLDDLSALADARPELRGLHPLFAGERGDSLRAFEIAADALARRIDEGRWLPPIAEWLELAMLRELYEDLANDEARRRIAYDTVRHVVTNYAADLFNRRGQKPMANALFRWMQREARWAQDDDLLKVNTKNTACGF